MYFFTHIYMAKILYHHLAEEIPLDKRAFAYGNIKPDLPSPQRKNHTLENYLAQACICAEQLMEEEVDVKDFSVNLGVVCHFVCDFFCYYHLEDEIHDRKLKHFLYELTLHWKLHRMGHRRVRLLISGKKEPRRDLEDMIFSMRADYMQQPHLMKKDIQYALVTARWACDSILYYKKYTSELAKEVEQAIGALLVTEGGSI
jgi:hypothetical protein